MRTRQIELKIRLNEAENRHLMALLKTTGLTRAALIRSLLSGVQLRPRPPGEYAALLRELSAMGNNLNQLARLANFEKKVSPEMMEEALHLQAEIWKKVKHL